MTWWEIVLLVLPLAFLASLGIGIMFGRVAEINERGIWQHERDREESRYLEQGIEKNDETPDNWFS